MERKASIIPTRLIRLEPHKENFGLSRTEFDRYVDNLINGDESLFTKVFKHHFHKTVSFLMSKFSIEEELAYDACMESMLDFRSKILNGKIQYGNLNFLFKRMAVNRFIDDVKYSKKIKGAISVFCTTNSSNTLEKNDFLNLLDESISMLSDHQKELIHQCFYTNKDLLSLANENNENYANLRKRKERVLKKLKTTFFEKLKISKL